MKLKEAILYSYLCSKKQHRYIPIYIDQQGNTYDSMRDFKTEKEAQAFLNRDRCDKPIKAPIIRKGV